MIFYTQVFYKYIYGKFKKILGNILLYKNEELIYINQKIISEYHIIFHYQQLLVLYRSQKLIQNCIKRHKNDFLRV